MIFIEEINKKERDSIKEFLEYTIENFTLFEDSNPRILDPPHNHSSIWKRIPIEEYSNKINLKKIIRIIPFIHSERSIRDINQIESIFVSNENIKIFKSLLREIKEEEEVSILLKNTENMVKKVLAEERIENINTETLTLKNKRKIPVNLKWEQITISFQDEENINLWINETLFGKYSFIDFKMGKAKPTRLWEFLKMISSFNLKEFKDKGENPNITNLLVTYDSKELIEKIVSDLNKKLKSLFNQTENPFYKYKIHKEYRAKFKLKPESIDDCKKNAFNSESLDENNDYEYFLDT